VRIVISPYHLSTREPPAMASLLLASRVLTLMPGDGLAPADATREALRTPAFADLARAWAWATPLFDAGVLALRDDARSPLDDLRRVHDRIRDDARYAPLRAFVRDEDAACDVARLGAISRDILRAGVDPGLSVPVAAALDRFALRAKAFIARAPATSLAQRAESRLAREVARVGIPILAQATAERVLHARAVLRDALASLRDAFEALDADPNAPPGEALADAARDYADAFHRLRADVLDDAPRDDVRCVESVAVLSLVTLPADAALESSVRAIESLAAPPTARAASKPAPARAPSANAESATPPHAAPTSTLPVLADSVAGRSVRALIVRTLGTR
jgi:hypothetical protein